MKKKINMSEKESDEPYKGYTELDKANSHLKWAGFIIIILFALLIICLQFNLI